MNIQPQDTAAVKAEIQSDPTGLGYAGKSAEEQCRLLCQPASVANPQPQAVRALIPLWQIKSLAMQAGWWAGVEAATANPAAVAFMAYYADFRFDNLNIDLPKSQEVMAGLVATNLIDQSQSDAVAALANQAIPGWTAAIDGPSRLQTITAGRSGGICHDELTTILET